MLAHKKYFRMKKNILGNETKTSARTWQFVSEKDNFGWLRNGC